MGSDEIDESEPAAEPAETGEAADSGSGDAEVAPSGSWKAPRFKGQGVLSGVAMALGLLILLAAVLTVWLQTTVLNTDEFVDTVGPLIEDPEVTDALARTLNEQIFAEVSTQEVLDEELPDLPAFVPSILDSALERVTLRLTEELLQTQLVADIWQGAVRAAHETATAIISGDTAIQDDDGDVVLDLSPVIENLTEPLQDLGLNLGLAEAVEESDLGKVVLVEDGQLGLVQDAVELLDTLSWFLPLLAVLLLVGAVYISKRRRTSTLRAAIGVFVMMVVLGLVLRISRNFLIDNAKEENRQAIENIWDHVLRRLTGAMLGLAALSLVVFFAMWLTGKSNSSAAARARVSDWLDRLRGGKLGELTPEGLDEKIAPRRRAIQIGAILVTVAILWALPTLSGTAVIVAAVLLGLFLLAVEFVVRPPKNAADAGPESDPEPEPESDDPAEDSELADNV